MGNAENHLRSRLIDLSTNIRVGWKCLQGTNTPAYFAIKALVNLAKVKA